MKRAGSHIQAIASLAMASFVVAAAALLLAGCSQQPQKQPKAAQPDGPRVFASPDEAVQALVGAVRAEDAAQLLAIMGPDGQDIISSGDEIDDRNRAREFIELYDQKRSLMPEGDGRQTLIVGEDDWPFPVPIVRRGSGWEFDAAEGREEIINRRVGENELSTIEVCKAIADAQREFALRDADGDGARDYARQFASDPGKHNGLFWPTAEGEQLSPMGVMAAAAAAEGYKRREEGPTPYHGYIFRLLESQGSHAPGGAVDYIVNGEMLLGFAVVAYPAEYGVSGVMTFIMGPDGVVYQKDLGDDTEALAKGMTAFDPGEGWVKAEAAPATTPATGGPAAPDVLRT